MAENRQTASRRRAAAAVCLASPEARMVTGTALLEDGGWTAV